MTPWRVPSRSAALVVGAVLSGCAGAGHDWQTASPTDEEQPRRAPAVAVDPALELPEASSEADSRDALLTLHAPADPERARSVVRRFFDAVVRGSVEDVLPLLDETAWVSGSAGRQNARSFWQARLARFDYPSLSGRMLFREADMETYVASDVSELSGSRKLPLSPQKQQVLVRVPIVTPRSGRTRLFGDEIAFLLTPEGTGFVISEMQEDFQLQ